MTTDSPDFRPDSTRARSSVVTAASTRRFSSFSPSPTTQANVWPFSSKSAALGTNRNARLASGLWMRLVGQEVDGGHELGEEETVGVEDLDLDLDGPARAVAHRDDLAEPAAIALARDGADGDLGGLADRDPREQLLGDVGLDVHPVQVGQRDDRRAADRGAHGPRGDDLPLLPLLLDDRAVERGEQVHVADVLLGLLDVGLLELDGRLQRGHPRRGHVARCRPARPPRPRPSSGYRAGRPAWPCGPCRARRPWPRAARPRSAARSPASTPASPSARCARGWPGPAPS